MSADTSDLDKLSKDFLAIPAEMVSRVKGVVAKSAVNTKKIMQADARKSSSFKKLAPTINYDLKVHEFGGDGVIEAEIGPSGGGAASLAGIAYFGTSRGGGTVRNPEDAMLEEAPNFYEYAYRASEGLL
ncbi:hypothetical protein HWD94_04010 [Pseudarthrobacter equi]|uniref:hypothetical protein n=1 Tax=Pseudarthrobacter equi TaxID=728066 RepID=UPI0021BF34E6|nr:hypothetical protein [Pseudarthrobacter equi]MCT9624288.1 hypothetical protein [Pseudarthrobacter equi]